MRNLGMHLRISALICFILATIDVGAAVPLVPLGLALWVGSTLL